VLGIVFGVVAAINQWSQFTQDWIAPFGTIFVNLLKLIAVPLVLSSLITGVASLHDLTKLSRIGGKTIAIYIATTISAITIGLILVNTLRPGDVMPPELSQQLQDSFQAEAQARTEVADTVQESGPLQPLVNAIPQNLVHAASNNRNMLQVVFFALFIGVGLILVRNRRTRLVQHFFAGINDLIIRLVDIIMHVAPYGVFALIAGTITSRLRRFHAPD